MKNRKFSEGSNKSLAKNFKKRRKNYFLTLILTVFFWVLALGLFFLTDPYNFPGVLFFLVILFFGLFITLAVVFNSKARGLIISTGIIFFLILRYYGAGHIINLFILTGICFAADIYFKQR